MSQEKIFQFRRRFDSLYWQQFLLTALLCAAAGTVLHLIPVKKTQMHSRDGFAAVALSWVLLALFGALPYVFTGAMTSYIDALFETVSGLTTTGSSTFTAVSHLPRSVLLWRSLTQWMGGMGVLVLFLALTPRQGEGAVFLMRAESPGPIKSKLVPKVGGTAKILYVIYVALTAAEAVCLRIAGEDWFFAVNHALTTMATGGFSTRDVSIAGQSTAVMWIITVFSFLAGVNFSLMFLAVRGKLKTVLRSEELRIYVGIVAAAMALALLYALVPKGALLTVAKCTGGLIMLLVVIRPLLALDLNGLQVGYEEWERTIQQQTDDYTAANQQEMEVIIQQETVAYISEKAAELGLTCSPEVTCQLQDGVPFPVEVTMDIPKNAALSRIIAADLGIDEAHQRWRETE